VLALHFGFHSIIRLACAVTEHAEGATTALAALGADAKPFAQVAHA
jgi:hypothetical protein